MLLQVKDIRKSYKIATENGWFKQKKIVLKGVSLELAEGSCLGIIGESGSGKSTLSRMILGVEKPTEGQFFIEGIDFWQASKSMQKSLRRKMSVVFQDYTSSVNPNFTVEKIILEALYLTTLTPQEKRQRILELLDKVELEEKYLHSYPHELSGGQLQRICIARAIAAKPKLVILDEAISSLDASTQLIVMDLLMKLKEEEQLSYLFITHDLMSITYICDQVCFMKDGEIIEVVSKIEQLKDVQHSYSRALLQSVLPLYSVEERPLVTC